MCVAVYSLIPSPTCKQTAAASFLNPLTPTHALFFNIIHDPFKQKMTFSDVPGHGDMATLQPTALFLVLVGEVRRDETGIEIRVENNKAVGLG